MLNHNVLTRRYRIRIKVSFDFLLKCVSLRAREISFVKDNTLFKNKRW